MEHSPTRVARAAVARVVAPSFGLDGPPTARLSDKVGRFDVKIVHLPQAGGDTYLSAVADEALGTDPIAWLSDPASSKLATSVPLRALCEQALRNEGIGLVHADCGWTAPLACRMRRAYDLPLIVSFGGRDVSACFESERSAKRFQAIFEQAFAVTVESEFMMKRLVAAGCPAKKLIQLRRGIDLDRFRYAPREPVRDRNVRLLFVGDLADWTAPHVAVRAFAELHRIQPQTELHVIGDGPQRSRLGELIGELALAHAVELHGVQAPSVVRDAMYASDLFVLPMATGADGRIESCPPALIQAQATGMPALATLHAALPEEVVHGRTGLLSGERDVAALAGNMLWLVKHPEVWPDMGWAAHEHVLERHDLRRNISRLESIYSAALTAAAFGRTPGSPSYQ